MPQQEMNASFHPVSLSHCKSSWEAELTQELSRLNDEENIPMSGTE
jgi:hypothetical protein